MRRIFLLLCFFSYSLFAEPQYELSICAIFKNDAPYLKEWIEYHKLVGVDHFYLYNNGSTDGYKRVLRPYVERKEVTLIEWPDQKREEWDHFNAWVWTTQLTAYEDAFQRASGVSRWVAPIDTDEFIVPVKDEKITAVLKRYEESPALCVYWKLYGTSSVSHLPKKSLLIETLTRTADPSYKDWELKSILKPELYNGVMWVPHKFYYKNDQSHLFVDIGEMRINHYLNRTLDFFYSNKIANKEKMRNQKLTEPEIQNMLQRGNDYPDEEMAIFRFVPQLRHAMGF